MDEGDPRPASAAGPAEFAALMERRKNRSGYTYRQLEDRASRLGDTLPRSTVADALRRRTLPRAEVVSAFVRACGGTDAEVEEWLAARRRLADEGRPPPSTESVPVPAPGSPAESSAEPPPSGPPAWRAGIPVTLAAVAVVVLAAVAVVVAVRLTRPDPGAGSSVVDATAATVVSNGQRVPSLDGWARIHPGRAPALCVTEGHDRTGRYRSEVAVQRPCSEAEPPRTLLERVRGDLYHVKWDHPEHGLGCLTAVEQGAAANLVEPRSDCRGDQPSQLFLVEPVDPAAPGRYRLRPADTQLCLGIRDDDEAPGAEVVLESCTGHADQEFVVEARPDR
ncbi:helix-turn-helix domain-containing protein [Actinosynnema sp. NPDC020468]|uniref:RICIN domain-containing protein n=1 Tax=Actinosynnema sp. NPDC020468 TaxID=3154488 RepID=UPI0033EA7671